MIVPPPDAGTEKLPTVETMMLPSIAKASMISLVVVSPTSLASK